MLAVGHQLHGGPEAGGARSRGEKHPVGWGGALGGLVPEPGLCPREACSSVVTSALLALPMGASLLGHSAVPGAAGYTRRPA